MTDMYVVIKPHNGVFVKVLDMFTFAIGVDTRYVVPKNVSSRCSSKASEYPYNLENMSHYYS